ncbi:MAG TPA: lysophospholipid acyltransferase family protein [Candidatus Rikenella faecigallinarum]|uniref:Lysophospholipid acyltransferase family protein n=1 Tax=Candidatus Rikenella faecigallinarum TaxID=2838745 RepID=A0A9D1QD39_9BACT|nr:lysophospholipid acyltransferase family protein [Candidatus Rikenella faecigallinarum]
MLTYYLLYPVAWCLGKLPYKVQFLFSDLVRWVLYGVVRYRREVVRTNLRNSFPEKSEQERKQIERAFYKHLADVFIETLSLASVSEHQIRQRMKYLNLDDLMRWTGGRSWISAMAHYGSWEYTTNFDLYKTHDNALAVYRPLTNKGADRFYHRIRSRFGVIPIAMHDVGREMMRRKRENSHVTLALIADQTPGWPEIQNWTLFLGQWTPFFMGMEKLALKFHMPVVFLDVHKVRRGYYEARFDLIYDGDEAVDEGEITRRYAERLEQMIRTRPELWMWSHRRWKHSLENWLANHPHADKIAEQIYGNER